jgi:hypothetical protein
LNIENIKEFSYIFNGCSSLSNANFLQEWKNVSSGNNFSGIFDGCSFLSDIEHYKIGMYQMEINF